MQLCVVWRVEQRHGHHRTRQAVGRKGDRYGFPSREEALACLRKVRPSHMKFRNDGYIPNHPNVRAPRGSASLSNAAVASSSSKGSAIIAASHSEWLRPRFSNIFLSFSIAFKRAKSIRHL